LKILELRLDLRLLNSYQTDCFTYFFTMMGGAAGTHRLFSHKSYKANAVMRTLLLMGHEMSGQNSTYGWSRIHRVHHKFTDTSKDPHNINRGVFFAHCGHLMRDPNYETYREKMLIDMSDLEADQIVMFFHK